jgi:hypothetical protein
MEAIVELEGSEREFLENETSPMRIPHFKRFSISLAMISSS